MEGTVGTIDAANNQFSFNPFGGAALTVSVSSETGYRGVASFGQLQSGMQAHIVGSYQAGGVFAATFIELVTDH